MRVVVADIPEDGARLTEQADPAALNLATPDVRWTSPVDLSAFVQRHDDDLMVEAEASGTITVVCSRCAAAVPQPYHGAFQWLLELEHRPTVELNDDLRQEILLSYPLRGLCREDCRGLCPTCGHNLNEGACACPKGKE